ncbi:hypothetical protein QUG56_28780, partial [Klebsiella michiganensis]|uniref:hypothetical protein n=1 Tax=Klebsiella michiganensis TaxID=1134687 RepID=UPI0025A2ABC1
HQHAILMAMNGLRLLCLRPSLERSRPSPCKYQSAPHRNAVSLRTQNPETTKACKQALFYLPALISSVYITVTVALHKVNLTYPTSMVGTR